MPRLYSTNRNLPGGFDRTVSFKEALIMGQAPDAGLFLPEALPRFAPEEFLALKDRPFAETASLVASRFLADEFDEAVIRRICEDAYDFPVPLEPVDDGAWILRLDRGPTASFKDFAARFLARVMVTDGKPMTVLVATSGDTGSAVGEAFKGMPGVSVVILYPEREVSPSQKRQLDTIGGNVRALALSGTFDGCQALVKRAFADPDLAPLGLTSANSINFGRILPQTFYYAYAWAQVSGGAPLVFSVPSGNFGNAFGCELARRMGLPVAQIVLATNANDEFPRFLGGEAYAPVRPSRNCLSNAMNVGHPSNLARFFDLYGGTVDKDGVAHREADRTAMRHHLFSVSVTDDETRETMRRAYDDLGIVLEPHGAVGWKGLEAYRDATHDGTPAVVLETAHPAKFAETVREILGIDPEPSAALKALEGRAGEAERLEATYEALKRNLLERA